MVQKLVVVELWGLPPFEGGCPRSSSTRVAQRVCTGSVVARPSRSRSGGAVVGSWALRQATFVGSLARRVRWGARSVLQGGEDRDSSGVGCARADSKARPCRRGLPRRPGRLCKMAYRPIVHISIVGVCLLAVEWLLVRRLCGSPVSVCACAWPGAFAYGCRGRVEAKAGRLLLRQAAAAASIEAWLARGSGAWGREGPHPTAWCRRKTGSGSSPMLPTV